MSDNRQSRKRLEKKARKGFRGYPIACPHEEDKDYPEGGTCPQCPFWADKDRWSGLPVR